MSLDMKFYLKSEPELPYLSSTLKQCHSTLSGEPGGEKISQAGNTAIDESNADCDNLFAEENYRATLRNWRDAWSSRGLRFQNIDGIADDL